MLLLSQHPLGVSWDDSSGDSPLDHAEQACFYLIEKYQGNLTSIFPAPNQLVPVRVRTSESSDLNVLPSLLSFLLGKGIKKILDIHREAGQYPSCGFQP